jgi:hypothetical protein
MDRDADRLQWISTEALLDHLHHFPMDFSVESPQLIVSEILEHEDGPHYVFVVRDDGGAVSIELVTVEGDVWMRQLTFTPKSMEELDAYFENAMRMIPIP